MGRLRRWAETGQGGLRKRVHNSGNQRHFWANHRKRNALALTQCNQTRIIGDGNFYIAYPRFLLRARIARRHQYLFHTSTLLKLPSQRMLASARTNHQYFHSLYTSSYVTASVPEVSYASEHHGKTVLVSSVDDFLISHRTPWLDHRSDARLGCRVDTIAERQECIRGHDSA